MIEQGPIGSWGHLIWNSSNGFWFRGSKSVPSEECARCNLPWPESAKVLGEYISLYTPDAWDGKEIRDAPGVGISYDELILTDRDHGTTIMVDCQGRKYQTWWEQNPKNATWSSPKAERLEGSA